MAEFVPSSEFAAGVQYASARYARQVAEAIERDMVDLCPVDTGLLSSTIHAEQVGDTVYVSVGEGAEYWIYVEYGTSKMAAQPFIRPALMRRRDVVAL